jgi:hypothetical protein
MGGKLNEEKSDRGSSYSTASAYRSTPGGPAAGRGQTTERSQLMRKPHHGFGKTGVSQPQQCG